MVLISFNECKSCGPPLTGSSSLLSGLSEAGCLRINCHTQGEELLSLVRLQIRAVFSWEWHWRRTRSAAPVSSCVFVGDRGGDSDTRKTQAADTKGRPEIPSVTFALLMWYVHMCLWILIVIEIDIISKRRAKFRA